jgi:hypothetical protein
MQTHSAFHHALAILLLCGWASAPSPVLAQSPVPGPEHQQLKVFVGEWDLDAESKAVPALGMNDSGKVVYHHVNEMTNGGFFLETHGTGMSARGPSGTRERYTVTYAPDLQSATVRSEHSKDGVTWYERLTHHCCRSTAQHFVVQGRPGNRFVYLRMGAYAGEAGIEAEAGTSREAVA